MKRTFVILALVPVMAALALLYRSEATRTEARGQVGPGQSVYFGFLLGYPGIGAVAFDLAPADERGNRALRAYVCDGLGEPEGMAIWFRGSVGADEAAGGAKGLSFTSVGGQETLTITALKERGVYGVFVNDAGVKAHFVAYPSFDGAVLDALATPEGVTTGTITVPGGKRIGFTVRSLALASPADLAAHGLPEDFRKFQEFNQVPGEYVAVIAPGGSHWFGRSGFVRDGSPGLNIIGLDKKE